MTNPLNINGTNVSMTQQQSSLVLSVTGEQAAAETIAGKFIDLGNQVIEKIHSQSAQGGIVAPSDLDAKHTVIYKFSPHTPKGRPVSEAETKDVAADMEKVFTQFARVVQATDLENALNMRVSGTSTENVALAAPLQPGLGIKSSATKRPSNEEIAATFKDIVKTSGLTTDQQDLARKALNETLQRLTRSVSAGK